MREKRRPRSARGARSEREKKRDVRGTVFVIKGATRGAEESQPHRAAHQSGTVRCPECTSIFRRVSPPRCHVIPHQRSPRKPRERVRSPGLPPADSEILGRIRGRSTVDARRRDRAVHRVLEKVSCCGVHGYRSSEECEKKDFKKSQTDLIQRVLQYERQREIYAMLTSDR